MSDVTTLLHFDNGSLTVERIQDVEAIIERNKLLRSEPQPWRRRGDWGRHVACVPNVIIERWLNEEWARGNVDLRMFSHEFNRIVRTKLDDPEWKFLRVDKI